jgi:GTP-binding protein EngB required for normal cell division
VEQAFPGSHQEDVISLRAYTRAKQEVVALIRATKQLFQAQDQREATERCQELVVRLAEDRFNLAVVGQFKRGKSTLMNAVLGHELLPTGLLPLTSAITTLCYGSTERVVLRRKEWALEQEIPLSELASWITERGNPGNEKKLVEARVELPLSFLRRGLYFIDTPGIGSARHENTITTYEFLPQMAAVIFVTSVDAPLSEAEERFLLAIREHVRQLFVVVNKTDMLDDIEREEVLDYIQTRVAQLLGIGKLHLFPLSARDGLTAKRNHDLTGIQRSGLTSFEQTLTTFLAEEQGRTFLVSVLDRALHLFKEAEPAPHHAQTESSGSALDLKQNMESLRTSLLAGAPLSTGQHGAEPAVADMRVIEQAIAESRVPARKARADEQMSHRPRTCSICLVQGQALFAFFAQWQYAIATDPTAQRAFVAARGFCPVHTWQFQEMASPLGISEGYAPLLEAVRDKLSHLSKHSVEHAAAPLADLLSDTATCPACRLVRKTADRQTRNLLTHLKTAEGRTEYVSSAGLCLPHLQATLAQIEHDTDGTNEQRMVATFLLREQVRRLEDLTDDLRSYALKRDAYRRGLLHQEEAMAWRRALVQLVGERAARGGAVIADRGTV